MRKPRNAKGKWVFVPNSTLPKEEQERLDREQAMEIQA